MKPGSDGMRPGGTPEQSVVRLTPAVTSIRRFAVKHLVGGPGTAAVLLLGLLVLHDAYQPLFSSFQLQVIANGSAALALAAIGETLVIISGGFDLSVGAVIALVNVFLATQLTGSSAHDAGAIALALGIGIAAGVLNGVLVAVVRLQSVIVTIATLFIFGGLALIVLREPGGDVPFVYAEWFSGSLGALPQSVLFVLGGCAIWLALRRSRFGAALFAIGGDPSAAYLSGLPVRRTVIATYAIAGAFYACAGVLVTAQTLSGDPRIGGSFLLVVFVAVVIGGTRLGGGEGSAIGSVLGAFIVTLLVSVLFDLGVDSFYTSIVEGALLILAVLAGTAASRFRPATRTVPGPTDPGM